MKPKNTKERRNSFLKFSLLFLVTVITIMVAVFFNFKVPTKENQLLKEQEKGIKKERTFQKEFSNEMTHVKVLLDSLDAPGTNRTYINSLISKKLVDLQGIIPTKDSTYNYNMYTRIVSLHVEIQEAKSRLNSLKDTESTIQEYKKTLEKCKDDYILMQRDLDACRRAQ